MSEAYPFRKSYKSGGITGKIVSMDECADMPTVHEKREIPETLDILDSLLKRLDSITGELHSRLGAVMDMEKFESSLKETQPAVLRAFASPLADLLQTHNSTARNLIERLEAISDSLEL